MTETEWMWQTNVVLMTMKWNKADMANRSGPDDNEMEELSQLVAEPGTSAPAALSQDMGDQLVLAHR